MSNNDLWIKNQQKANAVKLRKAVNSMIGNGVIIVVKNQTVKGDRENDSTYL